jgi:hypothetical protein
MKKIFTLSTGIVFLISILIAGGCNPTKYPRPKRVIIYLKAIGEKGKKQLDMSDSNGQHAIDSLTTDVQPGTIVIWKREWAGKITKIDSIYPTIPPSGLSQGVIFTSNPRKRSIGQGYKYIVPDDAKAGRAPEKYKIEFTHKDSTKTLIDPFLRIPPIDSIKSR